MKTRKIPMRMCVGCKEMKPKKELIRVVHNADGEILLDTRGKENGRGAYICHSAACFQKAVKTRAFQRAFGKQLSDEVISGIESELSDE